MRSLLIASALLVTASATPVILAFLGRSDAAAGAYEELLGRVAASCTTRSLELHTVAMEEGALAEAQRSWPSAPVFYAGHGMEAKGGGVAVQAFAARQAAAGSAPAGVILLNAFLQRTWRPSIKDCAAKWAVQPTWSLKCPGGCLKDGVHDCPGPEVPTPSFPVPSLTIGGSLDGVVRIARVAEAWYTQKATPHAVTVVEGMNHASFLGNGMEAVLLQDLPPAISKEEAQAKVSDFIADFLKSPKDFEAPTLYEYFKPFADMFVHQEGSWWWTSNSDERGSSAWAADAQRRMALPLPQAAEWVASNEFRLLSDEDLIPPYFRGKHRANITVHKEGALTIESRSVTQLRYVKVSVKDTAVGTNGFAIIKEEKAGVLASLQDDGSMPVAAIEIATKLASRQLVYSRLGLEAAASLDDGNRCQEINQAAYDLALDAASEVARARYKAQGRPMFMGADTKPFPPAGPFWIWNYLQMNDKAAGVEVDSLFAFYSLSGPAYGAGNHYCKLLSPAMVLEWIYTDSLRRIKHVDVAELVV